MIGPNGLLNDSNSTFQTSPLDYSWAGGDTSNLQSQLFQRSDGTFELALWRSVSVGTYSGGQWTVNIPNPTNVTVSINNAVLDSATSYAGLEQPNMTSSNLTVNNSQITVPVGAGVVFVHLTCLPPGWTTNSDIGNPTYQGFGTSFASTNGSWYNPNGTFQEIGGGGDIWGTSDQFKLTAQPYTGDAIAVAKVNAMLPFGGTLDVYAKSGVMFRDSTAANAMFVDVVATPTSGVYMQYRSSTGGSAANVGSGSGALSLPVWVELVRSGNVFTGYYSTNGTSWTALGSTPTINMSTTAQVGLAVAAHYSVSGDSVINISRFSNVQVTDSFTDHNIGSPGKTGTTSYNAFTDTYTVTGGGADIWSTSDHFNFASKSIANPGTGGGIVFAAVAGGSLIDTDNSTPNPWAKAGVMWRDGTAANAKYAAVFMTPGNGIVFQWRSTTGGTTGLSSVSVGPNVYFWDWVRVVDFGGAFVGQYAVTWAGQSPSPSSWSNIGSTYPQITMGSTDQVGLAVTAHDNTKLLNAPFAGVDPRQRKDGLPLGFTSMATPIGLAAAVVPSAAISAAGSDDGSAPAGDRAIANAWSLLPPGWRVSDSRDDAMALGYADPTSRKSWDIMYLQFIENELL
jgi:hypothetical protein